MTETKLVTGGVYLLIADDSTEFQSALKKTADLARQNNGRVAILYVMEEQGFLHWGLIEKRIQNDQRAEAEKHVREVAAQLMALNGQPAIYYLKDGKPRDAILEVLDEDPTIKMLVLGAGTESSNPLVSYFTRKGLKALKVPLLVVPDSV